MIKRVLAGALALGLLSPIAALASTKTATANVQVNLVSGGCGFGIDGVSVPGQAAVDFGDKTLSTVAGSTGLFNLSIRCDFASDAWTLQSPDSAQRSMTNGTSSLGFGVFTDSAYTNALGGSTTETGMGSHSPYNGSNTSLLPLYVKIGSDISGATATGKYSAVVNLQLVQ